MWQHIKSWTSSSLLRCSSGQSIAPHYVYRYCPKEHTWILVAVQNTTFWHRQNQINIVLTLCSSVVSRCNALELFLTCCVPSVQPGEKRNFRLMKPRVTWVNMLMKQQTGTRRRRMWYQRSVTIWNMLIINYWEKYSKVLLFNEDMQTPFLSFKKKYQ